MASNPPSSSRTKRRLLWAFIILLFCLTAIWLIFALGSWNQRIVMDFDYLEDLNAPAQAVPESERAWPPLRQALLDLDLQGRSSFMEFLDGFSQDSSEDWVPEWFDLNESRLDPIREAVSREGLGFIHVHGVPVGDDRLVLLSGFERDNAALLPAGVEKSLEAPGFMALELDHRFARIPRGLARLLLRHAKKAAGEGESLLAVEDIVASLDLGRLVAQDRLLISQLVGYSIYERALTTCLELLTDPEAPLDRPALEFLARVLDDPRYRPGPIDFHGEQAVLRDIIQRFYTSDGSGDGLLDLDGFAAMSAASGTQLPLPLQVGVVRSIFGPLLASGGSTRAEVEAVARRCYEVADDLQRQDVWALDWAEYDAAFGPLLVTQPGVFSSLKLFPLNLVLPALDAAISASHQNRFRYDFVRLIVALHLHRIDHGEWADTLQAMVPEYLSEIPRDPFDGESLRYRLVDGLPLIWSIGADRIDQSGATFDGSEASRWLVPRRNDGLIGAEDLVLWPLATSDTSGE